MEDASARVYALMRVVTSAHASAESAYAEIGEADIFKCRKAEVPAETPDARTDVFADDQTKR